MVKHVSSTGHFLMRQDKDKIWKAAANQAPIFNFLSQSKMQNSPYFRAIFKIETCQYKLRKLGGFWLLKEWNILYRCQRNVSFMIGNPNPTSTVPVLSTDWVRSSLRLWSHRICPSEVTVGHDIFFPCFISYSFHKHDLLCHQSDLQKLLNCCQTLKTDWIRSILHPFQDWVPQNIPPKILLCHVTSCVPAWITNIFFCVINITICNKLFSTF